MKKIYIFNPDNDLALANFGEHYTPPHSALKIGEDLDVLPIWFSEKDSRVICREVSNSEFENTISALGITFESVSWREAAATAAEIMPWGWNPSLRRKMIDMGFAAQRLPTMEEIALLKSYSSRENAVKMLRELKESEDGFCGESYYFSTLHEVLDYLASSSVDNVLKMPNSGSGKGLVWIQRQITAKQTDWCRRVIREQGGVVAEPKLNKIRDFAMEFSLENGKADFVGYSLFKSAISGAYTGNMLLPDDAIEKQLSEYAEVADLQRLKTMLKRKLPLYFPKYRGFVGVDMMICKAQKPMIQPCVEINMRMNMGLVAHTFRKRFVKESSQGVFVIDFFKKQGEALEFHSKNKKKHPLHIENKQIVEGYLNLNPIAKNTCFTAYAVIERQ